MVLLNMSMADDVKSALAEACALLADIQNGTKAILNSPPKDRVHHKKEKVTSSWAKSSTPRTKLPVSQAYSSQQYHETESSTAMAKSSAGYTISKSSRSTTEVVADIPFYDVNDYALSKRKRPISAVEMRAACEGHNHEHKNGTNTVDDDQIANRKEQPSVTTMKNDTAHKYSFGKSKRELHPQPLTESPYTILDISRGEKLLWEKPQTAVLFSRDKREFERVLKSPYGDNRAPAHSSNINADAPEDSADRSAEQGGSARRRRSLSAGKSGNVRDDMLSTRQAAPAIAIAPEHKTKSRKPLNVTAGDYGTPGPGAYADSVQQIYSVASGNVAGGKFTPGPSSAARKARRIASSSGLSRAHAPGPGHYDVGSAESVVRQKVPGFSNVFKSSDADKKLTPQLQRKRYWEEKARDLREEHDDMKDASDSIVKSRTPVVQMRPDVSNGITFKNREIIRRIRAEKSQEASVGYYEKKYDIVEKTPRAPVKMEREVQAVSKTQAMLAKAGIMPPTARRALETANRDRFLGPQLPVPWGEDRLPPRKAWYEDNDDGNESPTEEVLDLLKKRGARVNSVDEDNVLTKKNRDGSADITEAFLRSSYAGAPTKNAPAVAMRAPKKHDARRLIERELTEEEKNRDFLPTQLHHDWASTDRDGGKALDMDIVPGRDVVKVLSKGVVDRVLFNEGIRRGTGDMGPGVYDAGPKFGEGVKGGVVDFENFVAREDAVGPRGERPAAVLSNRELEEEGLYYKEEVIVDAISAKQKQLKREPVVKFSDRDRFDKPKAPEEGLQHLGGSWFEGMAEEVTKKQSKVVHYDTMVGRGQDDVDEMDELGSLIDGHQDGDVVKVDVVDWKPHKERAVSGPQWSDPKRDPRFVDLKPDKGPDAPPSPEPNFDCLKPRQGVGVVNFGLQKERWQGHADEEVVVRKELGEVGYAEDVAARKDAADLDTALEKGEHQQSKKKKEPMFVDMGKQRNRPAAGEKSEAPDVVYDVKEGVTGREERRDKGVLAWSEQLGRDAKVITKEKIPEEVYSDDEEVMMEVNPDASSRVKRTVTAPAWSTDKTSKTAVVKEPLGNQLDYNLESEFGKGPGAGGVPMGMIGGRHDNPTLHEVGLADKDEELDIEPDYELLRSGKGEGAARGGVAWSKQSGVRERAAEKQGLDEDPPEGQVLDINPRIPDFKVSGKVQNTGFGGRANEDTTRRGAKEAMDDLMKDQEELNLQPKGPKDLSKNTQTSWKKENDINIIGSKKAMHEYDIEEELILAPRDTFGKHANTMPSWGKQVSKSNDRPDLLEIYDDREELILSPRQQEDNRRTAASSWVKQADPAEAKLSLLGDSEELILEPKKVSDKKQKSGVPWSKQRDSTFDVNVSVDRDIVEELILSPKEIQGEKHKGSMPWKYQPDREYIGYAKEVQNQPSEELILSPKEVRTSRGKTPLSWKRQSDAVYDTNKSLDKDAEELILSPNFRLTEKSNVGSNIGPMWKTQASRVIDDTKAGYEQSEELKLSPKDHRKKEPVSTLQWSRQSDAFDATNDLDRDAEELYLSPKDARATGGGNISSMKSTSNRDGAKSGTKQTNGAKGSNPPATNDLKGKSKMSVSFQDSPVKDEKRRAGSVSGRTSRSGSTSSTTSNKQVSSIKAAPDSGSKNMKSRSATVVSSTKRGTGAADATRPTSTGRIDRKSSAKSTSNKVQPRESSAPTPPRVSAPSPYAAAPPEGFGSGVHKRSNADVMASLDRRLEQLELYD